MRIRTFVFSFVLLFASLAVSTLAQADEQSDNIPDPPARAARLQYMTGSVSVQPHGTDDWIAAVLNRPLTNSDNIWADKDSRAEISVGTGLIRMDSETSLTLTNISENLVQLQLHQGAMNLHVRRLYNNESYEVDTPNQAFTVLKPGDYRFDVDSEGDKTVVTVWRGEGESSGDGPAMRIRADQQAKFTNGNSMTNDVHPVPDPDDFDQWARSRDERLDHSESARYVSPDVVGYEDLDEYGSWRNSPEYGAVWVPSGVAAGWAPYRFGHWIWVAPWGWTWVEDEPWGFAPFHYGRWVYSGGYWGWAPGPVYVRPYYAPALVAWFGGPGWGVSVGFGGGYGWCPLGWGEPFVPWYRVSRGYFSSVNITNTHITNVTNISRIYNNTYINNHPAQPVGGYAGNGLHYANLHAPNGFTAVPRSALVNSQSAARSALRVSPNQLTGLRPVHSLDVNPTRNTMLGPNPGRSSAVPPSGSFARPTISRMSPATANRPRSEMQNGGETGKRIPTPARGTSEQPQIGGRQANGSRLIPRPPEAQARQNGFNTRPGSGVNAGSYSGRGMVGNAGGQTRVEAPQGRPQSIPRPPSAGSAYSQGRSQGAPRSGYESGAMRGQVAPPSYGRMGTQVNVPRPPSAAVDRGYSQAAQRQGYSGWSGPRPSPTYQASNRPSPYSGGNYARQVPGYGGGSYGRTAPNYDRGSMARSAPTYRGGYGSPSASYGRSSAASSGHSYGGGHSSGGFGGGGGSRASGGGSHTGHR